ncbi:non-ribosomal peptide synthetase [Streptomyces sp. NPDC059255]|uniref:non-ribosomal peptide synthetase n=1 Tax=Streptomyces sp. NPDC059255 TaxID=3346793 RepID=UPI0036AD2819
MNGSITESYLTRYRAVTHAASDPATVFPLSGAQRRFLLSRNLDPLRRPDIVPLFFHFPQGAVDVPRLRRAAIDFAGLHTVLCGRVGLLKGTPVLRADGPSVEVRRVPVAPGGTAREAVRRELRDWDPRGPSVRLLLARGQDEEHELLALALDHLVCDEQSLGSAVAGLSEAYGRAEHDSAPWTGARDGVAYREVVESQLATEREASQEGALGYWGRRLSGLISPEAAAPADPGSPGPAGSAGPSPAGRDDDEGLEKGMLTHRLPAVPPRSRGSLFPALLSAVSAALHARPGGSPGNGGHAGRPMALGYPWGGRPAGAPEVMGCFINTLVHPASAEATHLADVTAAWWDDLDHAGTPYDEVVRAARLAGGTWPGTLHAILTYENLGRRPSLSLAGVTGQETHLAVPLRYAAPIGIAASHGEDLLIRLVWERDRLPVDHAREAFRVLLHTLHTHGTGW